MDTFVNVASTSLEAMPLSSASSPMPEVLLDKPKRPLSGYNMFFRDERQKLLQELAPRKLPSDNKKGRNSHYKIAFGPLAKTISARWQTLDARIKQEYEDLAQGGRELYFKKARAWKQQQKALGLSPKKHKGSSKKPPKAKTDKSSETKRLQVAQGPMSDLEPLPFANERNQGDLLEPIAFANSPVSDGAFFREPAVFSNASTRNTRYPHEAVVFSNVSNQNAEYLHAMCSFNNCSNPSAIQSHDVKNLFMVRKDSNGLNAHDTEAQFPNLYASDRRGSVGGFRQDDFFPDPYQGATAQNVPVHEGWGPWGQEAYEPCDRTQYAQLFGSD